MPELAGSSTFAEAIRDAIAQEMHTQPSTILLGLGVNDPGRIFGTTAGLVEEFGLERVFETPTSENAMMGVAVGAALAGHRPILTHQRVDFFFLALDQLVNSAAKWRFMFGAQFTVPLVVRLIVGRGWGQGPTHSQNIIHWLSQLPGIELYYPSTASDAYSLMRKAIQSPNPAVFFEDRWLHELRDTAVEPRTKRSHSTNPLDLTICSYGFGAHTARVARKQLVVQGIRSQLVDFTRFNDEDHEKLASSALRTGNVLFVDQGTPGGAWAHETLGRLISTTSRVSQISTRILSIPSIPQPTGYQATVRFYPGIEDIVSAAADMLSTPMPTPSWDNAEGHHDIPGNLEFGPF